MSMQASEKKMVFVCVPVCAVFNWKSPCTIIILTRDVHCTVYTYFIRQQIPSFPILHITYLAAAAAMAVTEACGIIVVVEFNRCKTDTYVFEIESTIRMNIICVRCLKTVELKFCMLFGFVWLELVFYFIVIFHSVTSAMASSQIDTHPFKHTYTSILMFTVCVCGRSYHTNRNAESKSEKDNNDNNCNNSAKAPAVAANKYQNNEYLHMVYEQCTLNYILATLDACKTIEPPVFALF